MRRSGAAIIIGCAAFVVAIGGIAFEFAKHQRRSSSVDVDTHVALLDSDVHWPKASGLTTWTVSDSIDVKISRDKSIIVDVKDVRASWTREGNKIVLGYFDSFPLAVRDLEQYANGVIERVCGSRQGTGSMAKANLHSFMETMATKSSAAPVYLGRTSGTPCAAISIAPSFDEEKPWLVRVVYNDP
jgi:hypothetical protein